MVKMMNGFQKKLDNAMSPTGDRALEMVGAFAYEMLEPSLIQHFRGEWGKIDIPTQGKLRAIANSSEVPLCLIAIAYLRLRKNNH